MVHSLKKHGRITIANAEAITSSRRHTMFGCLRTTLINQIIVGSCYLGISPTRLALIYLKAKIPTTEKKPRKVLFWNE